MDKQKIAVLITLVIVFVFLGFGRLFMRNNNNGASVITPVQSMQKTVSIEDTTLGTGAVAYEGALLTMQYTGFLADGTKFDSSYDHGGPIQFVFGAPGLIPGWTLGVVGMKEGGKRRITIPPELAYGVAGNPPVIPANATITFDLELVKVEKAPVQPQQ